MSSQDTIKLAVLDDYQSVALEAADWSLIEPDVAISVFDTHLGDADAVVRALEGFDIIVACERERHFRRLSWIGYQGFDYWRPQECEIRQ